MSRAIEFHIGRASKSEIAAHLCACDNAFFPPLSSRLDLDDYAQKIFDKARCFEAWEGNVLVGLIAVYCNAPDRLVSFISHVSVLPNSHGKGIASRLMADCIAHVRDLNFACIELEVDGKNDVAIALYKKHAFATSGHSSSILNMALNFERESSMNQQRDYNAEIRDTADHQYAYGFDFDVMHPYMIRSFEPFFRPGKLLELGSYKGDFTRRFLDRFDDVTCVEASGEAIAEAKRKLSDKVTYVHSVFETAVLPHRYDNIVLTHVLEHLDDPVRVLKRINDEWLTEGGRLFLVCPNANAASRQIAVKMGLISHNAAVTPAESEHGHRCTYSLDTLERDAVAAGLMVVHRSGVFFKALANFQWDRLLKTDIISKEYLEGCYHLGQQYPDLCSSIFLLCERRGRE